MDFVDDTTGWRPVNLHRQRLLYTQNGGRSWRQVAVPVNVTDLATPAAGVAYLVGNGDVILKVTVPETP